MGERILIASEIEMILWIKGFRAQDNPLLQDFIVQQ